MRDEMKPCPFCGMDEPDWCDTSGGDYHHIQCRNCESCTGGYHKTRQEAVDAWNMRATTKKCSGQAHCRADMGYVCSCVSSPSKTENFTNG